MHRAALPERRLLVADRREQRDARSGRASRRARRRLPEQPPRAPRGLAPDLRGPRPRARPSAVRARQPEAGRRPCLAGSRARRPPSSSLQALGHAQRLARRRPRVRRTSSRPSSSAKNGLPAVASCTRASSGARQLEPQPLLEQVVRRAPRLSGPTESRVRRSSGRSARARADLRLPVSSEGSPGARRFGTSAAVARSGAPRPRPGRATADRRAATTTGPRSARAHRTSSTREPDRVWVWRRLARLGEQERDLERPPPRRHERMRRFVEHRGDQLRETCERERRLGLDAAADENTAEPLSGLLDSSLPEDRLADPASPESTSAAGPCSTSVRNASIAASSSSRPMTSAGIAIRPRRSRPAAARRAASPARRTPSFR